MIVRTSRTLDVLTFAEKHPIPHVVVGRYDPHEQIDEEATGQPSFFRMLSAAVKLLPLLSEHTGTVESRTASIRLSYALAEDAARVRQLVIAVAGTRPANCASIAFFDYDKRLYDKLRAIRDEGLDAIDRSLAKSNDRAQILRAAP